MSSCHYGKTQGRATGVEKLKEAEKWLFYIKLWRNAGVLSLARGRHILVGHQSADLSSGRSPRRASPKCPSGEENGSCCQESQGWNSPPVASPYLSLVFAGPCRSEGNAVMAAQFRRASLWPH